MLREFLGPPIRDAHALHGAPLGTTSPENIPADGD